jgi:CheY-like chemotaxis protein
VSSPLPENEEFRLKSLHSCRILETSSERGFDDIAHLAALMCDAPFVVIAFVDQQRVWFKAQIGLKVGEIPRDDSFCAHAILQSDVLIVTDPISDERFMNSLLVQEMGVRFYAGIPLTTVDNYRIGTLAVMDRVPHLMTAEQIDSLQILARRIVGELERRRTTDAPSSHPRLHLAAPYRRSVTILIVEDDSVLRELLQRALEAYGFSVLSAANGAEALHWSERHEGTIEIVVTDLVLSDISGLEFSKRIRGARPETKLLFVTDFGDQVLELLRYEANILEKPFLPSELVRKVDDIINQGNDAASAG